MRWLKAATWVFALLLISAGVAWFVWPRPVPVDLASVTLGPMEVTVDDEARTSLRHIYTVSAPVTGKLLRISSPSGSHQDASLHVGDQVIAGETVVAVLQPMQPGLLDIRSREELQAVAAATEAAVTLAEAEMRRIEALLAFSRDELGRAQSLAATNAIPSKALEAAQTDVAVNEAALESAKAQLQIRQSEQAAAQARLMEPDDNDAAADPTCCIRLTTPATGVVLRILQQSEGVLAAGSPILEIGDPRDLEIVADLLSTNAVQIKPGAAVRIDEWGGPTLGGRVSHVEPDGFAKVSALGIEELRVRTLIDLVDPPEKWSALGNDFRVTVHIALWSTEKTLTVPVAALFRKGDDWAVFALRDGRARATVVEIGQRNERSAEVLSGLVEGDEVVLHPSDRIIDGTAVTQRQVQ